MRQGIEFKLGYSPERINPGDQERRFEKIVKVVAGEDTETTDLLADLYGAVVSAGVHRAPSIEVAEAAKVIENTQRDLNIALMNELAIIFGSMGIRTRDVLDAAATKWNFLPFAPGLVGGHCISVDPYYLTFRAEEFGYHPEVILAGRRINDTMGIFVARNVIRLLSAKGLTPKAARIGILGITFKENVADTRNSRVPDIVAELARYGARAAISDCAARSDNVSEEYGISLVGEEMLTDLDALVFAVPHRPYLTDPSALFAKLKPNGAFFDIKSALSPALTPDGMTYWSL